MKQNLMGTEQAAKYLGVKLNTMEGWRVRGEGPRFRKIGRLVRYTDNDLDAYVEAQARSSTSEKAAA